MLEFEKDYKLYNLLEALSLDDEIIDDEDDNQQIDISAKKQKVTSADYLALFINDRILNNNDSALNSFEEIIIKNVNNDKTGIYDNYLTPKSENDLILYLNRSLKYFGLTGNYNWINTGSIEKMVKLFPLAFPNNVAEFNGDISRWDVSNVKNMLGIFEGCTALKCDISNWNTSNVKWWTSQSIKGCNTEFKNICKKLKFPKLTIRTLY